MRLKEIGLFFINKYIFPISYNHYTFYTLYKLKYKQETEEFYTGHRQDIGYRRGS